MTRTTLFAAALLCGCAGGARAAEPMAMHHGASMAPMRAAPEAGTPSAKAYAAANDAMMKGMEVKPTGDADRDFAAMMLPHHQGAIDMAKVEVQYGRDPVLRKLAADIVAAQEKEIVEMRAWQEKHAGAQ